MHEHIFSIFPLDKAIALGCVEPLHCAFFFHLRMFLLLFAISAPDPLERAPKQEEGVRKDSRSPLNHVRSGKQESNALPLYNRSRHGLPAKIVTTFEFFRFRFHFRALDQLHFPQGKSANVVRGAFGAVLRDTVPPEVYSRLFEPGSALGDTPSGLADWPRPFVLRVAHLDGLTVRPSESLFLDAHVFDLHQPALQHFEAALARLAEKGLGPGRGRA